MWARAVEAVLGVWLVVSAFLFAVPDAPDATAVPVVAGLLVLVTGAAATRSRRAHFFVIVVAVALVAWGWVRFARPGPAAAQNAILVGLTLGLFGIIPNDTSEPPPAWRRHIRSDP